MEKSRTPSPSPSPSPPVSIKDAVYKLQLSLLEGISNESQLIATGSILSKSDYQDVVTERSIANLCGYPLCPNLLPSDSSARKGRYRISLKEHKVYDLRETDMYCSSGCVVNSRAFAGSLEDDRLSELDSGKVSEVLRLFGALSLGEKKEEKEKGSLGKNGDLGLGNLRIEEKPDMAAGEVRLEDWIGPSNAIEGYVPHGDRSQAPSRSKSSGKGSKPKQLHSEWEGGIVGKETAFTSEIIFGHQSSTPKTSSVQKKIASDSRGKKSQGHVSVDKTAKSIENQLKSALISCVGNTSPETALTSTTTVEDKSRTSEASSTSKKNTFDPRVGELHGQVSIEKTAELNKEWLKSSLKSSGVSMEKRAESNETQLKSALKSSRTKTFSRSVTWADEKNIESVGTGNLCDIQEVEDKSVSLASSVKMDVEDVWSSLRFASAEACAIALSQAAEAVAAGETDIADAVSEAGIVILPPPHDSDEENLPEDVDILQPEEGRVKWPRKSDFLGSEDSWHDTPPEGFSLTASSVDILQPEEDRDKWPRKPVFLDSDGIDSEDSWHDTPPEGFSLTLSSFATMWMALFGWISASSLAYIYGHDESSQDEFLYVDGREYLRKVVLSDGRSSEIKQTLSGCIARALPGLVANLRLPTPISNLEQALGRLLDTMSFVDALPPFMTKQWHVIVLLFIDALSVRRIPSLVQHMASKRMLLHKVLGAGQVSVEEYEVMKGLLIPLGRLPEFSVQSGG